jgi:hypothetical protein
MLSIVSTRRLSTKRNFPCIFKNSFLRFHSTVYKTVIKDFKKINALQEKRVAHFATYTFSKASDVCKRFIIDEITFPVTRQRWN